MIFTERNEQREVTTEENAVVEDILSMGRSTGIEVNKEDVDELVEGQSSELTTEELSYPATTAPARLGSGAGILRRWGGFQCSDQ